MKFVTMGYLSIRMGVPYSRLFRFVKGRSDLPGQAMIGNNTAFAESSLDELRAVLVAEGVIRETATEPALTA